MRLRDVEPGDVEAYVRMRCDPVMMTGLGGPLPREGMEDKVARDVRSVAEGGAWIKMIIPEEGDDPEGVAGSVVLWSHTEPPEAPDSTVHAGQDPDPMAGPAGFSEIGWLVLPAYQGRGLAKRAVRALLAGAEGTGRWGLVHAFPAVDNAPSNGICRSLGFRHRGTRDVLFAGRSLRCNHWTVDSRLRLPG